MRKIFFSTLTASISLLVVTVLFIKNFKKEEHQIHELSNIRESGSLRVAIDESQPGFFRINSTEYGYDYVLLKEFCETMNLDLEIVQAVSSANTIAMLESGQIDMACTINTAVNRSPLDIHTIEESVKSNFVILSQKETPKLQDVNSIKSALEGKKVLMPHNFTTTNSYKIWLDSISNCATISYAPPSELITMVERGDLDFLVCSRTDALLHIANSKKLKLVYTFDEQVSSVFIIKSQNRQLETLFSSWLDSYKEGVEYAMLNHLYGGDLFIDKFIREGYLTPVTGISLYDDLFKESSVDSGYDWQFISAIAYTESRYKSNVRSHKGAIGMMQIMPKVAKQFDVSIEDVQNPIHNVDVAIKLLKRIEKSLRFTSTTSVQDRLSIILACYNGGIGHVLDARNLARKYGANPNSWSDVKQYLEAKAISEFYNDDVVKSGSFNASETTQFVDKVLNKYQEYNRRTAAVNGNQLAVL